MELRFTVWEFVRLMVHLEDADTLPPAAQGLRDAWRDIWTSLDEELARLAEEDFDAYSTMMMDQDVVIEDATLDHAHAAAGALTDVMNVMDAAIAQGSGPEGDDEQLQSLKFERRELRQLARKLSRLGSSADA